MTDTLETPLETTSRTLVLGTSAPPSEPVVGEIVQEFASVAVQESPDDRRDRLIEAFQLFMQYEVANGEPTADTIRGYFEVVRAWMTWCRKERLHPGDVAPLDVQRYRAQLREDGKALSTTQLHLSVIRRFYDAALEHGVVERNPAKRVRAPKDPTLAEDKVVALNEAGLRSLLATVGTKQRKNALHLQDESPEAEKAAVKRDRAIVGLMALHGLRRIEAHRLDHESLKERESGVPYLLVHGKGNKLRRIHLRADTFQALLEYEAAKNGLTMPITGAFFVGHSNNGAGERLSRRSLNNIADKYLNEANLKRAGVSCHALRHTFGTLAVAGGAKVEQLRDAMGHADIATTGIYVKALERQKNNPANFIGPGLYDGE